MQRKPLIRTVAAAAEFLAIALATSLAVSAFTVVARGDGAQYFPRDLRRGDEGLDVFNLQVALNESTSTAVASTGPGSKGEETGFFGAKTEAALVRYQSQKGISPASGVADLRTRTALNDTLSAATGRAAAKPTEGGSNPARVAAGVSPERLRQIFGSQTAADIAATPNFTTGKMVVFPGQTLVFEPGASASVFGHGFEEAASYTLAHATSGKAFATAKAATSMSLALKVPRIKEGRYTVRFVAANGATSNPFDVFVSKKGGAPKVTSVSPKTIARGDKVVVRGQNFGATGNSVVTTLGRVDNLAARKAGKEWEITFTSELGGVLPPFMLNQSTATVPATLQVETPAGPTPPAIIYVAL